MGFFDKLVDSEKTKDIRLIKPSKVFAEALRQTSGASVARSLRYNIYYNVYAFYGVVDGIGTSTLVANVALAIAEAGLTVCVFDTSIISPTQDVLLKTDEASYDEDSEKEHLDWFDMPFTKKSVLHVSKYSRNVSVLSFKGGRRGIVDYMSPNDSETIVSLALSSLQSKFDIILIDCCHEMTSVNTACLQQAQQVIQVWNDSPSVMSNMETYITNAITLSCPLDKMRYVIYNRLAKDAMGSLDGVLQQYRLKHLATSYFSEELYLKLVIGKALFRCESTDPMVIDYTEFILRIACHILNINIDGDKVDKLKDKDKGKISVGDIMDGKVEGTVTKKLRDREEQLAVKVDTNPMGHPDYGDSIEVGTVVSDGETVADEKAYAVEAMQYGGVMEEDDVKEEDLADKDGNGVPDIFENPDKGKKRRGFFGKRG